MEKDRRDLIDFLYDKTDTDPESINFIMREICLKKDFVLENPGVIMEVWRQC